MMAKLGDFRRFATTACMLLLLGSDPISGQESTRAPTREEFEGWLEPYQTVRVSSSEMGVVEHLAVVLGQQVAQGQLIARLDQEVQTAQLELARQRAEAQGQIQYAQAEARLRRTRCQQLTQLLSDGAARPEEVARAAAECELAEAQLLAQQEEAAARRLELGRAELAVRRRSIQAPLSGTVSEIQLREGEYLSPIRSDVVQLIQVDPLVAVFILPLEQTGGLQAGREVQVRLAGGQRVKGRIELLGPQADVASGTVSLRVLIANAEQNLRPGERCYLTLALTRRAAETGP